jgi:6,7-dimethyl-8-ribityllumazine synthase
MGSLAMNADTSHRFAIVVSRFNDHVTEGLLRGARAALDESGISEDAIDLIRVPGAFEIPLTAQRLAETGRFAAVVCLGCLIKGETYHFEHIASTVTRGIAEAAVATGVPMGFGVLTALNDEQAVARASDDADNKGREAALAAVQMVSVLTQIDAGETP